MQCFSIYASVLALKYPQHIPELLAYSRNIMRVSCQFKWPSWVIYDINYRWHVADIGQRDWSKVDPSMWDSLRLTPIKSFNSTLSFDELIISSYLNQV